jgi:hypothetical protein
MRDNLPNMNHTVAWIRIMPSCINHAVVCPAHQESLNLKLMVWPRKDPETGNRS